MTAPAALRTSFAFAFALALQALCACGQPDQADTRDTAEARAPDCEPGSASADILAGDAASTALLRGIAYPDDPEPLPERVAYLTFDDGPSEWTPNVLEILAQEGILATFFITSRQLKGPARLRTRFTDARGESRSFQEVLASTLAQGHSIGNHTVDHVDLAMLDSAAAACQLDANERAINDALGEQGLAPRPITLLRPPFGSPWRPQRSLTDPAAE
jgi:peptidoglycan/xylan/chitin deacetylase (PgdA/CDA1 family)